MARPRTVPLLLPLLLLLTSVVAVQYHWLNTVYLPGPAARSVSAPSAFVCALRCETMRPEQCSGFHYESSDGMCHLFSADCRGPAADSSQLTAAHYMARNTCPGTILYPCDCPPGFGRCSGRCLTRMYPAVNYTNAVSQCSSLGAHLAVPRSDEENQCALAMALDVRVWLGLSDVITEGEFVGADGCGSVTSQSPYWGAEQPNNYGGQDVVALVPTGETRWGTGWQDVRGDEELFALCQLPSCHRGSCP